MGPENLSSLPPSSPRSTDTSSQATLWGLAGTRSLSEGLGDGALERVTIFFRVGVSGVLVLDPLVRLCSLSLPHWLPSYLYTLNAEPSSMERDSFTPEPTRPFGPTSPPSPPAHYRTHNLVSVWPPLKLQIHAIAEGRHNRGGYVLALKFKDSSRQFHSELNAHTIETY